MVMSLRKVADEAYSDAERTREKFWIGTAKSAFESAFGEIDAKYFVKGSYVVIKSEDLILIYSIHDCFFRLVSKGWWGEEWSKPFKDKEGLGKQLRNFESMYIANPAGIPW